MAAGHLVGGHQNLPFSLGSPCLDRAGESSGRSLTVGSRPAQTPRALPVGDPARRTAPRGLESLLVWPQPQLTRRLLMPQTRQDEIWRGLGEALAPRYRLEEELPAGGMGRVFRAFDVKHSRSVAIKLLRPEIATPGMRSRFAKEVKALAALRHPHILPLIDSGDWEGLPYFITPFIEGDSLSDRISSSAPMGLDTVLALVGPVADALDYAHRLGFVHRDIKPSNILISAQHAILADFGITRILGDEAADKHRITGPALGTPQYMSPEQVLGESRLDGRADVYSLGCVVFEMLTGEPPFGGRTSPSLIAQQISAPPPRLAQKRPDLGPAVDESIGRALAKQPTSRYRTAGEFYTALRSTSRSHAAPPRLHLNVFGRSAAVLALAGAIGLAAWTALDRLESGRSELPASVYSINLHAPTPLDQRDEATVAAAGSELARLLSGWDEVDVLPGMPQRVEAPGATGAGEQERSRPAQAAEAGATHILELYFSFRSDSLFADARTTELGGSPKTALVAQVGGLKTEALNLMAHVAAAVLGIPAAAPDLSELKRDSRYLAAVRLYLSGESHLEGWLLTRAEADFRTALALDSTFARAHQFLATTLYWSGSEDPATLPELQGEMRSHIASARRRSAVLGSSDSTAVEAMHGFFNGDYDAARRSLSTLIAADSTDLFAWVMLGAVEYRDPFVTERSDGSVVPRGNWNSALRAFRTTVRLAPDFFLGFGHLAEAYQRVADGLRFQVCYGFQRPGRTLLIGDFGPAQERVYLCPRVADSIVWIPQPVSGQEGHQALVDQARAFHQEVGADLQRWLDFAPANPRAYMASADWLVDDAEYRATAGSTRPWSELLAPALARAERGIELSRDTTAGQLVAVANLRLAAGDVAAAVAAVDRARSIAGASVRRVVLSTAAANPYVAAGRYGDAYEVGFPAAAQEELTVRSPDGMPLRFQAEESLFRLRVLGSVGVVGLQVPATLREIEATWAEEGYSPDEADLLRRRFAGQLRLALLGDSTSVTRKWRSAFEAPPPEFRGLQLGVEDPARSRELLDSALATVVAGNASPTSVFLTGVLAQNLGEHESAIRTLALLDSMPLGIGSFREEWGLRTRSWRLRAISLEALDRAEEAVPLFADFTRSWVGADPAPSGALGTARLDAVPPP